MATMSVSGVVSGMDWDSMIDEIITAAAKPAQVKVNKKTNLTNKKSLFEEMKVTMNSLQSSLSPLKLPSTYKAKAIDIERLDKNTSYKGVLTATVNADAEVNVWNVKVNQLATAQTNRSKQITGSSLASTLGTTLDNSTLYVNAGGQKIGIEVKATDSLQSLKSRINTTLKTLENPLNVTASVVDNKLILKSDYTGLGTLTNTETIKYNLSAVNKLSNMSISDDDVENVTISKGTTKYSIHKDYVIVNGNEIRWKQYDRSNEVALDDDVNVKYKMSADDVYTKSGTYGDEEAEISGFTMTDNGTLSQRVKIVDDDGIEYTYGTDFTITNGKVVWLEEEGARTNEPNSYTVSYSKDTTETYLAEGEKVSATASPASYTVQYTEELLPSTSITFGRHDTGYSYVKITAGSITGFSELTAMDGISSVTGSSGNTYLMFNDDTEPKLNINGTDYVYGRDYVIRKGASSDEMFLVPYTIYTSNINEYLTSAGKTMPDGVQISPQSDIMAGSSAAFSYSHTTDIDSSDTTAITDLLTSGSTDISKVVILKSDGTEYEAGKDYDISNGEIKWHLPNDTTDITKAQFADLQAAYASATEDKTGTASELSTVTLIDGKGVLRTYVDPDDPSIFNMSAGGQDYIYGRDYVLRVNDAGTGYMFDWLVEDSNTILDANTVTATYAAYKNISTSEWSEAPAEGTNYEFGFDYDVTTTASNTVNSTDTDKSLATVLSGTTINSSDYSTAITITNGTTTYTYGKDYVINSSGVITWLNQNSDTPSAFTAEYTFSNNSFSPVTVTNYSGGNYTNISGVPSLDNLGLSTFTYQRNSTSTLYSYVDEGYGKSAFTLTGLDGTTYEYGKDYAVRTSAGSTGSSGFTVIWANNSHWPSDFSTENTGTSMPSSGFTLSYNNTASNTVLSADVSTIEDALGFTPSNYSNLTLTDSDGNAYIDGTDYSIDTSTGELTWLMSSSTVPTHPADGKGYTLTYEAFDALTATGTYSGDSSQEAVFTVDSGYGNYDDTQLSYEQILSDLSLTSSSSSSTVADKFAANFIMTDGSGNELTYGTDYTITQGTDTDSTTGEHSILINWINPPADDFTLTYIGRGEGGGETISTTITRTATDSINPDRSSVTRALYSEFNSASEIRITDGNETYYKGIDFTVSNDGLGNAVINWLSTSEWNNQDTTSATSCNIYVTNNGYTTTYTGTRAAGSDDLTINAGSVTYPTASELKSGTTTITQGTKTFYEGIDYSITSDDDGNAAIKWISSNNDGCEWYYPTPGSMYTINHTDDDGNTTTYTASRTGTDTLNMMDYGLTTANGSISVQYGSDLSYNLDAEPDYETDDDGNYVLDSNGDKIPIANTDGRAAINTAYSIDITRGTKYTDGVNASVFNFNWQVPTLTAREGLPSVNDELTVEYEYDANTFDLSDDADGALLYALGFTKSDGSYDDYTAAQDAELEVDGETVYRASNYIGEAYDNELIKGVTIELKGVGEVSMDISHDAEKAVESIQTYVDTYNDLMSWINTRMTESQLDEDTAATVDSDDFRMRWGLLHGNALLRNTKSQMRNIVSQNFTFSFTQRKSSEEIYGSMSLNGLKASSTLRLRIGSTYVDVTIDPTDTLSDIVAKINDDSYDGPMRSIYYDENGKKLQTPLLKASVENDMLVINSTSSDEITMSGSAAMNALKMNYTYKGLYQIGIATTSEDYGKSGELEFDTEKFMEALEDNPDEVQDLMLKFAAQMDSWTKSMLNSSASGETKGTLSREIDNIQSQIDDINEYLEKYQERLDRQEETLRSKFNSAEMSISRLSQQASSIAAILNQLNGMSSNNSNSSGS